MAVQVRPVLGIGPVLGAAVLVAACVAAAVLLPAGRYTREFSSVVQVLAPAVAAATLGRRAPRHRPDGAGRGRPWGW